MRRELEHLVVQFLLEDVLIGVVLRDARENRGGQRLRFTGLRVDQEEFLLHSDGAHVMQPFCGPWRR